MSAKNIKTDLLKYDLNTEFINPWKISNAFVNPNALHGIHSGFREFGMLFYIYPLRTFELGNNRTTNQFSKISTLHVTRLIDFPPKESESYP